MRLSRESLERLIVKEMLHQSWTKILRHKLNKDETKLNRIEKNKTYFLYINIKKSKTHKVGTVTHVAKIYGTWCT